MRLLATGVPDPPDTPLRIVGDVDRAVGRLGDADGPIRGVVRRHDLVRAREAAGEHLVGTRWRLALERHEAYVEAVHRERRPVPRAMEDDERAVAVFGAELRAGVEDQADRRVMRGEVGDRLLVLRAVALHLGVAAVLG